MVEVAARVYRTRRAGERYDTDAPSTLRGASQVPLDVLVDQISLSGCHIVTPEEVSVGELISLGKTIADKAATVEIESTPAEQIVEADGRDHDALARLLDGETLADQLQHRLPHGAAGYVEAA